MFTNDSDQKIFEHALLMLQTEATNFAYMFIKDTALRTQYGRRIKMMSEEMQAAVRLGQLSPREGAHKASYLRNEIMMITRTKNHPVLLAYSKNFKKTGKELNVLLNEKSMDQYRKSFDKLSQAERDAIYLKAIVSSGKSNEAVNRMAMIFGRAGKGLFIFSLAIALFEIYESENKLRETARQGAIAGSSIAGGVALGTAVVATGVCVATNVLCVTVASIAGAIAAGLGMDYLFDGVF